MSDEPPAFKQTLFVYEDKPVFLTMVSGGIFIALVLYFLLNQALGQFPLSFLQILPEAMVVLVIVASIVRGRQFDVKIEINSHTGWVKAVSRTQEWEGYFFEAENMQVLQREIAVAENIITEYKLFVKLHDKSEYEVPLKPNEARQVLEILEDIKKLKPKSGE